MYSFIKTSRNEYLIWGRQYYNKNLVIGAHSVSLFEGDLFGVNQKVT